VAKKPVSFTDLPLSTIAIPGKYTTAAMLLRLYAPLCKKFVVKRFDEIMPSISSGEVDAGVIIHESRFTYQDHGLSCISDLGAWWEKETGHPIPLGGIAARKDLGLDTIRKIDRCIKLSVQQAFASPAKSKKYVRQHAQELDDLIIRNHIGLYVNDFSKDLGQEGIAAIEEFIVRGQKAQIFSSGTHHSIPVISSF
jgi:1,4-dihydroxy-6-naphthoate synthase